MYHMARSVFAVPSLRSVQVETIALRSSAAEGNGSKAASLVYAWTGTGTT